MGANIAKSQKIREEVGAKFDAFDYRFSPEDQFTFLQRAQRELTGGCAPDDFMRRIYAGYREFMIANAVHIILSKKKPEKGKFIAAYTPAPLIDEMWCLAILYSVKYKEFCKFLVGAVIDRVPTQKKHGFNLMKNIWPDYDAGFYELDSEFVVWIYNKDIARFLDLFYDIIKTKEENGIIQIPKNLLLGELKDFHSQIVRKYSDITIEQHPSETITSHPFFNEAKLETVEEIYNKIFLSIPPEVASVMQSKFCVGNKCQLYIKEYARFMTMIYFTKNTLTPSEQTDQVWHTHQSFTVDYRSFCMKIYGRFITHSPTVGGHKDTVKFTNYYEKTLDLYRFLFKSSPPEALWPCSEERFHPRNFVGSWYSLLRILQSVLRVIELYKTVKPYSISRTIMECYFSWTGRNLFSKERNYKIFMNEETWVREEAGPRDYWFVGGCAVMDAGDRGGGFRGECGGKGG